MRAAGPTAPALRTVPGGAGPAAPGPGFGDHWSVGRPLVCAQHPHYRGTRARLTQLGGSRGRRVRRRGTHGSEQPEPRAEWGPTAPSAPAPPRPSVRGASSTFAAVIKRRRSAGTRSWRPVQLRKEIGSIMVYSVQKENLGGRREGEAMRGRWSHCPRHSQAGGVGRTPLSPPQPVWPRRPWRGGVFRVCLLAQHPRGRAENPALQPQWLGRSRSSSGRASVRPFVRSFTRSPR